MTNERRFKNGELLRLPNGKVVRVAILLHAVEQRADYKPCEKVEAYAFVRLVPVDVDPDGTTFYTVTHDGLIASQTISLDRPAGVGMFKETDLESTALDVYDLERVEGGAA